MASIYGVQVWPEMRIITCMLLHNGSRAASRHACIACVTLASLHIGQLTVSSPSMLRKQARVWQHHLCTICPPFVVAACIKTAVLPGQLLACILSHGLYTYLLHSLLRNTPFLIFHVADQCHCLLIIIILRPWPRCMGTLSLHLYAFSCLSSMMHDACVSLPASS